MMLLLLFHWHCSRAGVATRDDEEEEQQLL